MSVEHLLTDLLVALASKRLTVGFRYPTTAAETRHRVLWYFDHGGRVFVYVLTITSPSFVSVELFLTML